MARVTSDFGHRLDPYTADRVMHKGLDIAVPYGTTVVAPADGTVVFASTEGGYGNVLQIDHGNGIVTVYGHLSRFASSREGAHVERGDTIGYVGMTGLATGPHLHFEFRVNGQYVDPQKLKLPDALPIDANLYDDFKQHSTSLLAALNP